MAHDMGRDLMDIGGREFAKLVMNGGRPAALLMITEKEDGGHTLEVLSHGGRESIPTVLCEKLLGFAIALHRQCPQKADES